jgi:hypothetical protein
MGRQALAVIVVLILVVVVLGITLSYATAVPKNPFAHTPSYPTSSTTPTQTSTVSLTPMPMPTLTASPTPTVSPTPIVSDQYAYGYTPPAQALTIQAANYNSSVVTLYVQQTSGFPANPTTIIIKDTSGNTVETVGVASISPALTSDAMATGTLYKITSSTITTTLTSGSYKATLITQTLNSFASPIFVV